MPLQVFAVCDFCDDMRALEPNESGEYGVPVRWLTMRTNRTGTPKEISYLTDRTFCSPKCAEDFLGKR